MDEILYAEEDEDGYSPGCSVNNITTVHKDDGSSVYLVEGYIRESSNLGFQFVEAIGIEDGELVTVPIFEYGDDCDEYDKYAVYVEYTISDWYFRANYGEGWDWLFRYDDKKGILYVPLADPELSDRYVLYKFDGQRMVRLGVDGGYWLHPSIRSFYFLETLFETENYRIRVDRMADRTYRYVSWKKGVPMNEEPELVIYDGIFDDESKSFVFCNLNYIYEVTAEGSLIIKKDGKVITKAIRP